jgi:crotonobetainyl-CoA:carnitine CoA-transferase CaiB-like acyl-CoA transferase
MGKTIRERVMLEGLKVVEFATYVAAPGCAAIMSDWGADVIKIESAGGDPMRTFFPDTEESPGNPVFTMDNRGKRGVVLNTSTPDGRAALIAILKDTDVFVTNLRPGALKRAKIDYESLKDELPKLIYCSVSGYGLQGEDIDIPAFDITAFWTRGGVAAATIPTDQRPFPCRPGFGDHVTATATLSAILAAIYERQKTGKGRLVEASLLRAGVYALGWDLSVQLRYGQVTTARPRHETLNPISGYFQTSDGRWFCMLPRGPDNWPAIAAAANRPDLTQDPRFADPMVRAQNAPALLEALDEGFGSVDFAFVSRKLNEGDVIWGPLQHAGDVVNDPQAHAAGCFMPVPDGRGGTFQLPAAPVRFPGEDDGPKGPAPGHGEHTREVLRQAGYSDEAIERLIASGAAGEPHHDRARTAAE